MTCSFKEFETQGSLARFLVAHRDKSLPSLIVASVGNTANAYNFLASCLGLPLFLIVPETSLHNLLTPKRTNARVVGVRGDYSEAIHLAEKLSERLGARLDGGVRNIARRAGLGAVYLNAVAHPEEGTHFLFDDYFQAVGSGSGAIGTWEAITDLLSDGRFGDRPTRIHVAQNEPFTPIPDAWNSGCPVVPYPPQERDIRLRSITARVLGNRAPAYAIAGGLRDVLTASRGAAWSVTNSEVFEAATIFQASEGADIDPAGAVALAALIKAIATKSVGRGQRILLHITGGGRQVYCSDYGTDRLVPVGFVDSDDIDGACKLIGDNVRMSWDANLLTRI